MKRALACLLFFGLFACTKNNDAGNGTTNTITLPPNGPSVIEASNSFALNILQKQLQADAAYNNKLVSPLSIYLALSMVYNGAAAATKDSMAAALQLNGLNITDLNATCKALIEQLPGEDSKVQLSIANSIWYNSTTIKPLQSFIDVTKDNFNAAIQPLTTPSAVNDWVTNNTQGKITKVLDAIPDNMLMFLVNAIYFKGGWKSAFKTQDTHTAKFYPLSGGSVNVPFMQQEITTNLYRGSDYRAIELPYGGGKGYSMYLIDKDGTQPVDELVANLSASTIKSVISGMQQGKTTVIMPKWEYNYTIEDMRPLLGQIGMGIACSDLADFSNMYTAPVTITKAIHKTYIKVDEEGTTAAAVTGIGMGVTSVGPSQEMVFDHPFLYIIAEKQTGAILFTGVVNNPLP